MTKSFSENTVIILRPGKQDETTRRFRLSIVRGPDEGDAFLVDGSAACPVLLGTSEACRIRLRDPEVSRRHASVEVHDAYLRVRDLDSSNGTFVNGTRIGEAWLLGDEEIRIGGTICRVELESDAAPVALSTETSFGALVGGSLAMRRLYPIAQRLAESDVAVVIEGETGTGKEVMAEAIHAASSRANGPFVVFDCTAVRDSLIESALFGHEKGAFTGASSAHQGVFEEANGGTLLIDEIGDLDKSLQAKLLRVIQKSEVRRLGGTGWIKVDVRVIAATRRDLDREVQEGRFRDDLFFRLAVARIVMPALRDRREDIESLMHHFWTLYGGREDVFPSHLQMAFRSHPWPGNVRELANTVARLVALRDLAEPSKLFLQQGSTPNGDEVPAEVDFIANVIDRCLPLSESRELVLREFERQYVAHLLGRHGGNATRAAASSGIGVRYLRMIRARMRQS